MLGGLCVGVGRVNNKTNNVLLSAGILFVAAGEQSRKSWSLVMTGGSKTRLLWSHIVFHQWCNHRRRREGQDLYSPHSSSGEGTDEGPVISGGWIPWQSGSFLGFITAAVIDHLMESSSLPLDPFLPFHFIRSEQHHRHHCLHLQQRRRPQRQTRRRQKVHLLLRLVFLLWRPLLHCGWDGGRPRHQHIHWEKQGSPLEGAARVHPFALLILSVLADTQFPLPQTDVKRQLPFYRSVAWKLASSWAEGRTIFQRSPRWVIHVRPGKGQCDGQYLQSRTRGSCRIPPGP